MSEYKDWLEQHQDNCDICQSLINDPTVRLDLQIHLEEARDKADAEFQSTWDDAKEKQL